MPSVTGGDVPPTFRIDLSLPPRQRYVKLAQAYTEKIHSLTSLFDDLASEIIPSVSPARVSSIARILLRRVYSSEETDELRGISEAVNIPMFLLVSLNVLLDLLLGCTSGGVRVREGRGSKRATKMLHFRTLDWGMDPLRDVIVQLEFVKSKSVEPEKVLATSITYVGFVGVLTGVREGLSLSLNFRPVHAANTRLQNFKFYFNHLMVLLGFRRSISSQMRQYLLPINTSYTRSGSKPSSTPKTKNQSEQFHSISDILSHLPSTPSTAAYLIFSTGTETFTMEKDNRSGLIRSSDSFIATTNHDVDHEKQEASPTTNKQPLLNNTLDPEAAHSAAPTASPDTFTPDRGALASPIVTSLQEAISESVDRLSCLRRRWEKLVAKTPPEQRADLTITERVLREWLSAYPTTNECTHFSCIMDAEEGKVRWLRRYGRQEVLGDMEFRGEAEEEQGGGGLKVGKRLERVRERRSKSDVSLLRA